VIQTFADAETQLIFSQKKSRKLPVEIQKRALVKLLIIDSAICEEDLKIPPGNKFEHLQGRLKEYCSIRINDQWRIQFLFKSGEAYEVGIVDYH